MIQNLLQFVEVSFFEVIFMSSLTFFALCTYKNIGRFFIKSDYPVFSTVAGFTLVGAFNVFFLSFACAFAKYIIYLSYLLAIIITIFHIVKSISMKKLKKDLIENIKIFFPIFVIYIFFISKYLILIFRQDGSTDFNCHLTYFADISQEIFKADYFSRIRVMDVYPYEWSKYHFFNGSVSAIPLALYNKKNLVTFEFSKFLTIAFYFGAIFDILKHNNNLKKALVSLVCGVGVLLLINKKGVYWPLFSNQYSALLFLSMTVLFISDGKFENAIVSSMLLACSNAHCLISGVVLFLYSLIKLFSKNYNETNILKFVIEKRKLALYCLLAGVCVLFTVFSGCKPIHEVSTGLNFWETLFSWGWLELVPFANFYKSYDIYTSIVFIIYIYLILRNIYSIDSFFSRNIKKIIVAAIFLCVFISIGFFLLHSANYKGVKRILKYGYWFGLVYFIPCLCIILNLPKNLKIPYSLYLGFSFIQYFIFVSSTPLVNYSLNNIFFIYVLLVSLYNDIKKSKLKMKKYYILFFLLMNSLILLKCGFKYSFFCGDDDTYHKLINFEHVNYMSENFVYKSGDNIDLTILNAIKGNRVHYTVPVWGDNVDSENAKDVEINYTSMSRRFIID